MDNLAKSPSCWDDSSNVKIVNFWILGTFGTSPFLPTQRMVSCYTNCEFEPLFVWTPMALASPSFRSKTEVLRFQPVSHPKLEGFCSRNFPPKKLRMEIHHSKRHTVTPYLYIYITLPETNSELKPLKIGLKSIKMEISSSNRLSFRKYPTVVSFQVFFIQPWWKNHMG